MLCYLDDVVGAAATMEEAQAANDEIVVLADQLGVDLGQDKCVPPTQ